MKVMLGVNLKRHDSIVQSTWSPVLLFWLYIEKRMMGNSRNILQVLCGLIIPSIQEKICLSLKLLHAGCHSNASVLLRASSNVKTGKRPSNVTTTKQKLLKFDFKFLLLGILFVNARTFLMLLCFIFLLVFFFVNLFLNMFAF